MIMRANPNPEAARVYTEPEEAKIRRQDAEPVDDSALAQAEEEEFVELWAGDPGNQGA